MQSRTMVGVGCEGPVRWKVYVPVTVESRISVLILKHPVPREARLTIEDVSIETRKVTGLATAFLTDVSDLRARSVERPLPMGTTLTMDMFKPDLVIRHGQEVTLIAAAGGIEVRATGKALADAAGGHPSEGAEPQLPESGRRSGGRPGPGEGVAVTHVGNLRRPLQFLRKPVANQFAVRDTESHQWPTRLTVSRGTARRR